MTDRPTSSRRGNARNLRHKLRRTGDVQTSMVAGTAIASRFQPLTPDECRRVHQAALDLLARVGMGGATDRVQALCKSNGCKITDQGRVLFPAAVVEDALAAAAKTFSVHGRAEQYDFTACNGRVNFCTGGAAVAMLDIDEHIYRPSTLVDLYDLARICDTLENIQWFTRPVVATDIVDLFELDINTIYASVAGTQKHIATSITLGEHVHRMLPMLDLLAGGQGAFARRPFCTVHATTVVSPMTFAQDSLDVACAAVEIGMPIHSQTGPQAGATAPAALAGALMQGCAESLASLTVINLLKPGHPVVIGNWQMVSDLRTGSFSGGGGEQALLGAAASQMCAFYGIPGGNGAGMSDSKLPDNQAGFEKGLTMMLAALAGGGFVYESAGMLASLLGCSFEAMIIDDDMLSNIRRISKGIEVTDETLSVSVVEDAVAGAGHFLGHEQTMNKMETEYIYPRYADRNSPDDWRESGATDVWQRATLRAKMLLDTHRPSYIPIAIDRKIRESYTIHLPAS